MKGKSKLSLAITLLYPLVSGAQGIDGIISKLKELPCYQADVNYHILMSLQPDVDYKLHIEAQSAANDTLAPCDYLIDWSMITPVGESNGFSAYYDGNAYTFHSDRLLEYHFDRDSTLFMQSKALPGVQRRAQFCSMLPQFIADELETIKNNPETYFYTFHSDTIISGHHATAIDGIMTVRNEVAKEFIYAFDKKTCMPIYSEFENNPGALVEQTLIAEYTNTSVTGCTTINEESLMTRYPEVFEKYRESNYAIENLPGQRLPGFALPTSTRERYSRNAGDPFKTTTLIVLLDPKSGFAEATVNDIRRAIDMMPYNADVIWAFISNNVDEIEEIVPSLRVGEQLLTSAKSLARDCGVASYPVTIIVKPDGTVADVILGYNNDMSSIVIQKAAIAAK